MTNKWWWPEEAMLLIGVVLVAVVAFSLSWQLGALFMGIALMGWEDL